MKKAVIQPTYYTFSTEGLDKQQIKLLAELERRFFEGATICTDLILEAAEATGTPKGEKLLQAWEYWSSGPHVWDRQSLKNPVPLSSLFAKSKKGAPGAFYISFTGGLKGYYVTPKMEYFKQLVNPDAIIYPFEPQHFYFQAYDDRLYLKYNSIIGSRYVAKFIDDL